MGTSVNIAEMFLGPEGRMIASSKGRLSYNRPNDLIVFNANVLAGDTKIWHGDLNLSNEEDMHNLKLLAEKVKNNILVLSERDARFEFEDYPKVDRFIAMFSDDGEVILGSIADYFEFEDGLPFLKKDLRKASKIDFNEIAKASAYITAEPQELEGFIEILDMNQFKSKNLEELPYLKFYGHIAEHCDKSIDQVKVNNVLISEKTATALNKVVLDHLKRYFLGDEYAIQKEFSMLDFGYGPAVAKWEGMEDFVVYIRAEKEDTC